MVVNNLLVMLRTMDETMGANFVDDSGCTGRVAEDLTDGGVGEDLAGPAGIVEMTVDIGIGLGSIVVIKTAADVETLSDGGVDLTFEQVPQFALPDQDQGHRALRIQLEVQKESDLLKHFVIQQMPFVNDDDRFEMMQPAQQFNLAMQLTLGVTTVELGMDTELFQKAFVEMPRCQLGVRDIKHAIAIVIQRFLEAADGGCLASAAFAGDQCEQLALGRISQAAQCLLQRVGKVQLAGRQVP